MTDTERTRLETLYDKVVALEQAADMVAAADPMANADHVAKLATSLREKTLSVILGEDP